jgi:hypothetical protein
MAKAYLRLEDGRTRLLDRVMCENEDLELQRLLELNHDLLPGEQIRPEDPLRWLLICREMPIAGPDTGADRWNIDFLFADQDAMPTLVECKRSRDPRARRVVVGQLLEYAANGPCYWTAQELRASAEKSASKLGASLDQTFRALRATEGDDLEAYFARMEENLREGKLRLVFFMELSSPELRSVVEFLNRQMERTEVLLVEAQQHTDGDHTFIVPSLFGYTEVARQVKRSGARAQSARRQNWNRELFLANLRQQLAAEDAAEIERFLDGCIAAGWQIEWGAGSRVGSFQVSDPAVSDRALFFASTDGSLDISHGYLRGTPRLDEFRERYKETVSRIMGVEFAQSPERKRQTLKLDDWLPHADHFVAALTSLLREFRPK